MYDSGGRLGELRASLLGQGTDAGIGRAGGLSTPGGRGGAGRHVSGANAGSSESIAERCEDITRFLEHREQLRPFFETLLPSLLGMVFGFQDGSSGWLHACMRKEKDSKALLALLAPQGPLLQMAKAVDADSQIKFVFPTERLPVRTQQLLRTPVGCRALMKMPHYAGRIKIGTAITPSEMHVGVLDYYFLWFVYYVVRSSGAATALPASGAAATGFQGVGRTTADLFHKSGGRMHPYLELLQAYLDAFIAEPEKVSPAVAKAFDASREAAVEAWANEYADARMSPGVIAPYMRSEPASPPQPSFKKSSLSVLILSIMVDAWLLNLDDEQGESAARQAPSPRTTTHGIRINHSHPTAHAHHMRGLTYQPPQEDLLAVLKILIKHLLLPQRHPPLPAKKASPPSGTARFLQELRYSPAQPTPVPMKSRSAEDIASSVCAIRKPVYSMLRRAFQQWPRDSTSRMSPFVDVLMAYIIPWLDKSAVKRTTEKETFTSQIVGVVGRAANVPGGNDLKNKLDFSWAEHIWGNIPFYSLLLDGFLNLQHQRVSVYPDSVARQLYRVLLPLSTYPQIGEIVAEAETSYETFVCSSTPHNSGSLSNRVQQVRSQLDELEGKGNSLHLSFMGNGLHSGGGIVNNILELLSDAVRRNKLEKRRLADAKQACTAFFGQRIQGGGARERLMSFIGKSDHLGQRNGTAEKKEEAIKFEPSPGHFAKGTWKDIKYKGEWMYRPIGHDEVAFLTRALVALSDKINQYLGLDDRSPESSNRWVSYARKRHWKVNLRPLSEKQSLLFFGVTLAIFSILRGFFMLLLSL